MKWYVYWVERDEDREENRMRDEREKLRMRKTAYMLK